MESSVQFICVFRGSLSDEYGYPCSTRELCGNDTHYGYDCPSQVPFDYNQDPCFNQILIFSPNFPRYPQQNTCLDQFQPPRYSVVYQPPQETSAEMLQAREDLMEAIQAFLKKYDHIPPKEKCMALLLAEEMFLKQAEEKGTNKQVQKKQEEKSITEFLAEEQATTINSLYQNPDLLQSFIYQDDDNDDDDYDEESIISMNADMSETPSPDAITTSSPIEEPKDSLIMEDEDIDTIPEKESDEENESSVENLFHILSESEATSDNESECDLPIFNDSPLDVFEDNCEISSRPLFDSYGDTTSSEYSSDDESILEENIDPLLEEFAGELALINPIPPGIAGTYFDPEGDSHLVEKLSYDNSSPRPPEEINSENIIEFFFAFPIPVVREELVGSTTTQFNYSLPIYEKFSFHDDPMKEKNSVNTTTHADISLPKYDSFHFDLSDTSLQLADKSDSVNLKVERVKLAHIIISTGVNYSDPFCSSFPSGKRNKTFDPGISIEVQSRRFLSLNKFSISFIIDPLSPVLETLLPFLSKNEDKVFNPGILVSKEEKSPYLLSHRGFKAFKIIHNFLNESPMMIYGGDMPILDVPYLHFYPP
ncbi:hypothetical protein Tco_0537441 [Tanacetum coccineum]